MDEQTTAARRRFVDPEAFRCPGCGEPVELGRTGGRRPDGLPAVEWVHGDDGSELCRTRRGVVVDPVEVEL